MADDDGLVSSGDRTGDAGADETPEEPELRSPGLFLAGEFCRRLSGRLRKKIDRFARVITRADGRKGCTW
jgi:hypothetical protein